MFHRVDWDTHWVGPAAAPDTYELIELIGDGGEGEVWKGLVRLSEGGRSRVAIKILPPAEGEDLASWNLYGHLLKSLDHPGLVRVIDVFTGPAKHRAGVAQPTDADTTDPASDPPLAAGMHRYVVMSLIEGLTLQEWLYENPDTSISYRLRKLATVASALDGMHSGGQTGKPVAHGDVKPSNIIIRDNGSSVLVDLGLTRVVDGHGRRGHSLPYAAAELFEPGAVTTPEADRFAFFATVAHTITGEVPAYSDGQGLNLDATEQRLRQHPLTARRPGLVDAVLAALRSKPGDRPQPLSNWLVSLTNTLSQTTADLHDQRERREPGSKPGANHRAKTLVPMLVGLVVVVLALTAATLVYVWRQGANEAGSSPMGGNSVPPSVHAHPPDPSATTISGPIVNPPGGKATAPSQVPAASPTTSPSITGSIASPADSTGSQWSMVDAAEQTGGSISAWANQDHIFVATHLTGAVAPKTAPARETEAVFVYRVAINGITWKATAFFGDADPGKSGYIFEFYLVQAPPDMADYLKDKVGRPLPFDSLKGKVKVLDVHAVVRR